MPQLIDGPLMKVPAPGGKEVELYVIPFDKRGTCLAPRTADDLVKTVAKPDIDNVFLFSHGWNNDWNVALERYQRFIEGFAEQNLPVGSGKCVLVGIYWPSTAFTFDSEEAPAMAGPAPGPLTMEEVAVVTESLPPPDAAVVAQHASKDSLNEEEANELADALLRLPYDKNDEASDDAPTREQFLAAWQELEKTPGIFADAPQGTADGEGGGPQTAGFLSVLDPRNALRLATVWRMKDRAGVVGAKGVGPLLTRLCQATQARIHLCGHSYGAKVVMTALCSSAQNRAYSAFLLQPAVSHLCFASHIEETGRPGGFARALDAVEGNIFTTFTSADFALNKVYRLALRRTSDIGEPAIAGAEPSLYAALGGFGPSRTNASFVNIKKQGDAYDFAHLEKLVALNSNGVINGHGDISKEATWWALHQLASRG